ncbi:MAG: patatin-like protein [Sphingomonadaceae bacterium]
MTPERELRLALVCYGGVSLAVYMHGIVKELWKLLRASEARQAGQAATGDTEPCWQAFLEALSGAADLRVICDILAGASAGGINAVLLAEAIARGHDLEPLTAMWLDEADVDQLLDPDARPPSALSRRAAQLYKEPVAWFAARQSASLASVDVPEVRAEIALKLARFVRSRWFKPPFSGDVLTAMLDRAMDAMAAAPAGPPLVPPTLPVDLHVTVTDYWGVTTDLQIHSPAHVTEREHRRLFAFRSPAIAAEPGSGGGRPREPVGERPALLLAARATASFPGAFPAASIGEIDRRLAETGRDWPGRAAFVARQLAGDRAPEEVLLIDGSVLNNAPFGPAIAAVRTRPAHREVDRRFVYIDPKPGLGGPTDLLEGREPGFFTAMFRALADIPREQPIRDSLEAIADLSAGARRIREVTDALTPAVDAAMQRAVGRSFFLMPLNPARLRAARSRIQSEAAREAGFAFGAYAQVKLRGVLDSLGRLLASAAALDLPAGARLRAALEQSALSIGAFDHEAATGRAPDQSGYVRFLRAFDIDFRIRRLRFFIRRLSAAIAGSAEPAERAAAEALKADLHRIVEPFEAARQGLPADLAAELAAPVRAVAAGEGAVDPLLARLESGLALAELDQRADRILLAAAQDPGFTAPVRRDLVRAWLGYPFFDIALLPLVARQGADGFDELKVDRIAPDDAVALRAGGTRACLKGWQLNAFAAFFSRAYRENDYLWGRLHAAERLVDIVASAVPEVALASRHWKGRLFRAILASERPRLGSIGPLFDELEGVLDRWID